MGGGGSLNIFKFDRRGDPKETLNWRVWIVVLMAHMLSQGRGIFSYPQLYNAGP